MRKIILLICCFIGMGSFSQARIPDEIVVLKGIMGALPTSSVSVVVRWDHTVLTTFQQDMQNVTVTVKDSNGDIVDTQTLDAREYDSVTTTLQEKYSRGDYTIEISTPEGILMGRF